jgi:hypothetical protein
MAPAMFHNPGTRPTDTEVTAVTREEIDHVCHHHNLSLVGFVGFEPDSLSVVSVEVAGMVLEEDS